MTYLSPYISRGVISTRQVLQHIQSLNLKWWKTEKIIQELAWRDYWQLVWLSKGEDIFTDLKHAQEPISSNDIPEAVMNAATGIKVVDEAIVQMYETGYMHNHMRMYVASICCNIANCHWLEPARWMYSHLLDGDVASNHLSWQWVAGAFSNKKYFANQENINRYFHSTQRNTFLDVEYEAFESFETPELLKNFKSLDVHVNLPESMSSSIVGGEQTLVYNVYNLDPHWLKSESYQRVLLLEPSFFQKFPVGQKVIDFTLSLSENINDLKVFVGEFDELEKLIDSSFLTYKEHPTTNHYKGQKVEREWMTSLKGYYPSFFSFWKKAKKEIKP